LALETAFTTISSDIRNSEGNSAAGHRFGVGAAQFVRL